MQSDEATRDLIEQWQTLMAANPEAAARATKQLEALREERDGLRAEVQRLTEKNKKLIKFSTDGVVALDEITAERNSLREVLKPDRPTPKQYTQHPPDLDWLPAAGNHPDLGLLVTERDALSAMAYRDAQIDELRAEVQRLTEERDAFAKECDTLRRQVITCGVAATHTDANLTRTGAYADKWDSQQAEAVRALRAERDALLEKLNKPVVLSEWQLLVAERDGFERDADELRANVQRLTAYVEAFRREERRADDAERDRDDARAEVRRLTAERDELRDVLTRNGFVPCDASACNCGSWHARYGLPERMNEIKDALADAGHPLANENGNSALRALLELVAERDEAQADYRGACKTIAEMHAAAIGETGGGPRRGVVEDVTDLRAERDALLKFAGRILHASREHMTDVDGADVQEFAFEAGLLETETVQEPCGEECRCGVVGDFPLECFRYTYLGRRAIATQPGGER